MKQHIEHLRRVFEILRREKFHVKLSKSEFALKKVQFLGHMLSAQGVHVDPKKIEAVRTWKTPENVKELQQFLGFANYYNRFVPQYAKIATPLTNLMKKNTPFKWEDVHQQAMEQLKTALTSAPVLILPDPEKDYVIEADASDQAVGAVLMQDQGKGLQPIAYLSKKLHGAELNYPIHDKEALAIITAFKTWRCYLEGRKTTEVEETTEGACMPKLEETILIYSRDMKQHIEHLRRVFEILRREKFYVKLSKSEFALKKVQFLGHMVSTQGVHVDPKKIEAVRTWKTPEKVKELQQFLGFANYYNRFMPKYAKIATPLTNLLKKNTPFKWEDVHQQAMEQLKTALMSALVLILPDPEKDYVIKADASDQAVGAVLMQDQGKGLQPIAYLSKKMHGAELNYPIHDKEALAIITAFKTWRCYLEGRKTTVYTDHCSLKYLKTQPTLSRRQVRWIDFLETHFDYDIVYKPGQKNKADALSRPGHVAAIQIEGLNPLLKGLFTHGYTIDPEIPLAQKKKLLQ
ncbi:unnamed protein product [Closterium sp. NIES-53]